MRIALGSNKMEIWTPRLRIPKSLLKIINAFDAKQWKHLSKGSGVDVHYPNYTDAQVLITDGKCLWHYDSFPTVSEWSCLFVLRNDTFSWVESRGAKLDYKPNEVGDFILLDIARYHRLNVGKKFKSGEGLWVALAHDFGEIKPTKNECEKVFRIELREAQKRLAKENARKRKISI